VALPALVPMLRVAGRLARRQWGLPMSACDRELSGWQNVTSVGSLYERLTTGECVTPRLPLTSPHFLPGALTSAKGAPFIRHWSAPSSPNTRLEVHLRGQTELVVMPHWGAEWEVWSDLAGPESVAISETNDRVSVGEVLRASLSPGGLQVRGTSSGGTVVIAAPPLVDFDIDVDGGVQLGDKVEATAVNVRSLEGGIRANKILASSITLSAPRSDVWVSGHIDGTVNIEAERVMLHRLLSDHTEIRASQWAVIQAAFCRDLSVRVESTTLDSSIPPLVVTGLHGALDAKVSSPVSPAVVVSGINGTFQLEVQSGFTLDAHSHTTLDAPVVELLVDELPPSSVSSISLDHPGAVHAAAIAPFHMNVATHVESVFQAQPSVEFEPSSAGMKTGVWRADEEVKSTKGLWAAREDQQSLGRTSSGKISPTARVSNPFFQAASNTTGNDPATVVVSQASVQLKALSWVESVQLKARWRKLVQLAVGKLASPRA
jgi:hypothetical protein